ncbi:Cytochrome P450, partial [Operophtera brumata]
MARIVMKKEHFTGIQYGWSSRFVGKYEFMNPIVIIRDLELVKKITVKDFEHFIDHRSFIDEVNDPLFGRNLFSLKAFTSSKMKVMVPFMVEVGEQMNKALKKNIEDSGASCAFGLKVDSHLEVDNQFYARGKEASESNFRQLLIFFGYSSFPTIMKALNISLVTEASKSFFRNLVTSTMQDREARNIIRQLTHEDKDIKDVDAGFATVEESSVGKKSINRVWSDDDLTAQAVLFFIAGFETVSSTMSFLLHELALHPDIQERLAEEIRENEQKNGGKFDYNSIQKSLRRWPAAIALDRICTKDYNCGKPNDKATEDFIIRKGTGISIPVWGFHHDPQFFPDPERFDPERFSENNKHSIKPFAYMPFGVGPRNCIGSRFALCEIKVMIYQLLHQIELSPCEKTCIPTKLATDTFQLKFVGKYEFMNPTVIIRDLELVKKITVKDFENFIDHRSFIDEANDPLFGRNLFAMKAFTSSKMKVMVLFMVEVSEQMNKVLKKNIHDSGDGYIDVDIKDMTSRFANDVVASCAFGLKVDSHLEVDNQFYARGKEASESSFRQLLIFFGYSSFPTIMKALRISLFSETTKSFFRNLVTSTMQDREARNIIRPDMIHLLMEAKKVWSDDDLTAQAVLFFIAGFETVSSTMSFLLHELALHPDIQERLAEEIRENEQKNGGKFDYNSIQSMTYLDMVVSESLRCWPAVVALDRICSKDYNCGKPNDKAKEDFIIRKGTGISIPVWGFHHDPQFFPDPERFALCEIKVMVYQLLHQIEVSPCEKTCIPTKLATDTFHLRFVGRFEFMNQMVFIRDLELVKKITVKDFEYFLDHRTIIDEETDPLFGRNLFSLKGDTDMQSLHLLPITGQEWKDMRSTLSPAFTSSKIRLMVPFMVEVGDQMMKALKKNIEASGGKGYLW